MKKNNNIYLSYCLVCQYNTYFKNIYYKYNIHGKKVIYGKCFVVIY